MDKYKEMYEGLSEDLKAKVTSCKSAEEIFELAKTEGIELTDEQMDAISGGSKWGGWACSENSCGEDSVGDY